MNKIILLAIVALVATAANVASQENEEHVEFVSLNEDNDETAQVNGDKKIFRGFCLKLRDDIQDSVDHDPNSKALSLIAEAFAPTAKSKVGKKAYDGIMNIYQKIDQGLDWAKQSFRWMMFTRVDRGEFSELINEIKAQINGENFPDAIKSACNSVDSTLLPMFESALSETKEDLLKSRRLANSIKVINETTLNNVGCLTIARLQLVSRGCEIMSNHWDEVKRYHELDLKDR